MKVKDIYIYPVKSLGGVSCKSAKCIEEGLQYDRRMMLATHEGHFVSQREYPKLATIGCEFAEGGFLFYDKNKKDDQIFLPHDSKLSDSKQVKVWNHTFEASKVDETAGEWFSNFVKANLTLFKMSTSSQRTKSLIKAPRTTKLSMADGYPYLFLSEASLADLNSKLDVPVPIDRFRANIILEDCRAYEEEEMDKFLIHDIEFRMIKQCARCTMITINQKTAEKLVEPLKTLSLYKKRANKVYFGMNAIAINIGEIKVGDIITKN